MQPVINRSVRDARAQLQTGHQDTRSYFSNATVATTDHAATIPTLSPFTHSSLLRYSLTVSLSNRGQDGFSFRLFSVRTTR
jgi:hypothetical protein